MPVSPELPYLNVEENADVALEELFSYDQLTIPAIVDDEEPDKNFYILNIKKQFICVTKNGEQSELYVKKATIKNTKLTLIKTSKEVNEFNEELKKTVNSLKTQANGEGQELFNAVYKKIESGDIPIFSLNSKGGKKGGGTRKAGGSRSR